MIETRELREWREMILGEKNERKIVDIKLVEENDFAPNRKTKIHKLKIENKRLTNELGQAKEIINEFLYVFSAYRETILRENIIKKAQAFINKE